MRNWTSPKKGKLIHLLHQLTKGFRAFFESGRDSEFRKLKEFIAS